MDDEKQILSARESKLSDEELLKYLSDSLSEEEKNGFEKKISGLFEKDAIDGLKQIEDKVKLRGHISQLNGKLPQLLRQRKHQLVRKKLKDLKWTIIAIIILLFLCVIGFVVIRMHNKPNSSTYNSSVFSCKEILSSNS